MKAVSPKRAEQRKVARERFMDGFGVYFDEVRLWLPDSPGNWPKVRLVESDYARMVIREFGFCFLCVSSGVEDVHHIIGGSRGRDDTMANLIPVCRKCHERVQSQPKLLPEVFRAKHRCDMANTSWVRLVLLMGKWPLFDSLS